MPIFQSIPALNGLIRIFLALVLSIEIAQGRLILNTLGHPKWVLIILQKLAFLIYLIVILWLYEASEKILKSCWWYKILSTNPFNEHSSAITSYFKIIIPKTSKAGRKSEPWFMSLKSVGNNTSH